MTLELAINGGAPVRETLLSYGHQVISEDDVNAVLEVLKSDYLTCGPAVKAFEVAIANTVDAKYVTAVANGTAALHIACLAAGIGPGDEVIVSPITFAASANCVMYCGGTPVFSDIDPETWNIDPNKIEDKITDRTKAIIAVDFGGVPVDTQAIKEICLKHKLVFIEDAAHSIGSYSNGKPVGSIADITTFSFHPVKTVTTGEGGAVTTNNSELASLIELYSKHGITRDATLMNNQNEGTWYYEQLNLGFNYRLSDLQAALGTSQLKRLNEFGGRRREIVNAYERAFSDIPEISFQVDASPSDTVRHLFCIKLDTEALGVNRRFVFDALRAEGIGVNVHYLPVYRLPYYKELGYNEEGCPHANDYYENSVTLPLHCAMTDKNVEDVIVAVNKVISYCRESVSD